MGDRLLGTIRRRLTGDAPERLRSLEDLHRELGARHHIVKDELAKLESHVASLEAELHVAKVERQRFLDNPFLTWRPPGHFYSVIPDLDELRSRWSDAPHRSSLEIDGVDLNPQGQRQLWDALAPLIDRELVFGHEADTRYHQPNGSFDAFDAAIFTAMIRHFGPKRLIEVGSGFSSVLMLDLRQRHGLDVDLTFIEPFPDTLDDVLPVSQRDDAARIINQPVQDVPTDLFRQLESGDVLFIDSTHVVKPESDVVDLFTRVVPQVPPGVIVHVHDIFHPFVYPRAWIEEGRAWNEINLLHALLAGSDRFEVLLFNDWFAKAHGDVVAAAEPRLAGVSGGSIWLRRRG